MRLLITGAAGMLGRDVVVAARAGGHEVAAADRAGLDVCDAAAVRDAVAGQRPEAIVNCAAWTDVDGAEAHEGAATAVNGEAPGVLAAAAAAAGARLVHVSTDYVFTGDSPEPYPEDAPTGPLSAYGRSKLAGEHAIAQAGAQAAIIRASWLFGAGGSNFVATMLRLASERDELTVVDDQLGCPTFTGHLAPALLAVAASPATGILHVRGLGSCSWYDLAVETFTRAGLSPTVHRGDSAGLRRPAPRPANSRLAATREDAPTLPPWQQGLSAYLAEIGALAQVAR